MHNGITAHRGDSSHFPENSRAAFEAALELEVDWIETDVRLSADGELVIAHDSHLGRVAGVDAKVRELMLGELVQLSLGSGTSKQSILTLEQALSCVRHSSTRISLQPKVDCVDEILAMVESLGMISQVGFNDHDLEKMSRVRTLQSDVPIFWDRITSDTLLQDLQIARLWEFQTIVMYDPYLEESMVKEIQDAGFDAGSWTVNDPNRLKKLVSWKVDRIYTDRPGLLINILQENPDCTFAD